MKGGIVLARELLASFERSDEESVVATLGALDRLVLRHEVEDYRAQYKALRAAIATHMNENGWGKSPGAGLPADRRLWSVLDRA